MKWNESQHNYFNKKRNKSNNPGIRSPTGCPQSPVWKPLIKSYLVHTPLSHFILLHVCQCMWFYFKCNHGRNDRGLFGMKASLLSRGLCWFILLCFTGRFGIPQIPIKPDAESYRTDNIELPLTGFRLFFIFLKSQEMWMPFGRYKISLICSVLLCCSLARHQLGYRSIFLNSMFCHLQLV